MEVHTKRQRELVREEGSGEWGVYIQHWALGAERFFADSLASFVEEFADRQWISLSGLAKSATRILGSVSLGFISADISYLILIDSHIGLLFCCTFFIMPIMASWEIVFRGGLVHFSGPSEMTTSQLIFLLGPAILKHQPVNKVWSARRRRTYNPSLRSG